VRRRATTKLGAALAAVVALVVIAPASSSNNANAASSVCASPLGPTRDPSNPLGLATAPGSNPLHGASFFIPGPASGAAAGAIAQLLGVDPNSFPANYSWQQLKQDLDTGRFHQQIAADPSLASKVQMLEKVASEPQTNRLSAFSAGGSPTGVYDQTIKIFCNNLTSDPGSIPVFTTYFLHPAAGTCPRSGKLRAAGNLFKQRIDAVARATGTRPAVFLLEIDGIGASQCERKLGSLRIWESYLRYEVDAISALPHTVVYLEAGYSDGPRPGYAARVLKASGVGKIRGFFTNDTHLNWTINEVKWGEQVSRMTGGARFIINTAENGNGPKKNPHPGRQGNEDNCNPPGRALGPPPTTDTGFPAVDAFLWTHPPGNSGGHCNGGPASGTFWAAKAIDLASRANARLGPNYPSQPY
jgi:endoglucanase